jgi:hypothetical protein
MAATPEETAAVRLALGRIFRLLSRPTQPGDAEQYEECRRVILDVIEPPDPAYVHCWARDRNRGASGG